jgi:hypothetical protein
MIVRGIMTLHGEPHPLTITATAERRGDDVKVTAIAHVADVRSTTSLAGKRFLARDDAAAQRIRSQFP